MIRLRAVYTNDWVAFRKHRGKSESRRRYGAVTRTPRRSDTKTPARRHEL
jgi:hypothetical protein